MADLSPTAGYEGNEPVQYSDENDEQFALREADFELRRAHAEDIQNGGASRESEIKALDAQYDADKAAVEARHDRKEAMRAGSGNVAPAKEKSR